MSRLKRSFGYEDSPSSAIAGFDDLYSLERSIDRRLVIFLVVFAFVIVGALGSGSSSLSSVGFSIGSLICWLLALSIILTTRKAGAVAGTLKSENISYAKIEGKLYSKFIRWILGYIIPVFCSVVLTFGSVASSAGWLNNIWFYKYQVESKIDQIKNNLPEIEIKTSGSAKAKADTNFEPIDSVMTQPVKQKREPQVQVQKLEVPNKHFKSIDSLQNQKTQKIQQPVKKAELPNEHFKPLK